MKCFKKSMIFLAIFAMVCAALSVSAVLTYINFQPTAYEQTVKGLVGDEKLHEVDTLNYDYKVYYLFEDGTKEEAANAKLDYKFDSWD